MFGKKKLYKIVWRYASSYTSIITVKSDATGASIIAAKNEAQAIKKFYKKHDDPLISIISFEEYKYGN